MSNVTDLLLRMRKKGVRLWKDGERLCFEAPQGGLDSHERGQLLAHKTALMALLERRSITAEAEPPIQRRSQSDCRIPITFSQRWMWNLHELDRNPNRLGFIQRAFHLRGTLDVDMLSQSLSNLVRRHEALRTRLIRVDADITQRVDADAPSVLEIIDLTGSTGDSTEQRVLHVAKHLAYGKTPTHEAPLFEPHLLRIDQQHHVLIVTLHHIVSDFASFGILSRDLFAMYSERKTKRPASLPILSVQFPDYALWQQATQPFWLEKHSAYWDRALSGAAHLRVKASAPQGDTTASRFTLPFDLGKSLTDKLRQCSQIYRTTLVMSIFAIYVATVMNCYRVDDVVIPFLTLGRHLPELREVVGFFGVPLLIRIELDRVETFADLLERVTGEYARACEHHDCCRIAAQLPEPYFVWNPMFNWLPQEFDSPIAAPSEELRLTPLYLESMPDDIRWRGELRVDLSETPTGVKGVFGFRPDSFTPSAAERVRNSFESFAEQLVNQPNARFSIFK